VDVASGLRGKGTARLSDEQPTRGKPTAPLGGGEDEMMATFVGMESRDTGHPPTDTADTTPSRSRTLETTLCPHGCGQAVVLPLLKADTCRACGTRLLPEASYCYHCGAATSPLLTLVLQGTDGTEETRLYLHNPDKIWTIGRTIEQLDHYVDIDLTPYDAKERGVSRSHATVEYDAAQRRWFITDLESQFGTYVDDQHLREKRPVALEHGQHIRLGGLLLRVVLE
jgi:hypothetical protein